MTKPKDKPLQRERKDAKRLLKDYRAELPEAMARVHKVLRDRPEKSEDLALSTALFVVARERGYSSWPTMLKAVETGALEPRAQEKLRCQFCAYDGAGWTENGSKCPKCGGIYDAQLAQDSE